MKYDISIKECHYCINDLIHDSHGLSTLLHILLPVQLVLCWLCWVQLQSCDFGATCRIGNLRTRCRLEDGRNMGKTWKNPWKTNEEAKIGEGLQPKVLENQWTSHGKVTNIHGWSCNQQGEEIEKHIKCSQKQSPVCCCSRASNLT